MQIFYNVVNNHYASYIAYNPNKPLLTEFMLNTKEFENRRKRLMDMMGNECVAILPTASVYMRSHDVAFPFRPNSDFYYLTGYPEPEAVAVITPDHSAGEFTLFCRQRDAEKEAWDGKRVGLEGACDIYGANNAFPIEDIDDILPNLIADKERIFYTMGNNMVFDQRVLNWVNEVRSKVRTGVHAPNEFISLMHILHDMRLYKSRHEISMMRKAAKISAQAQKRVMQVCKPDLMEYQIESELLYGFMQKGARQAAYPSIVGSGENSCILHYTNNDAMLKDGDVLLIDAGAEYGYYASDITRTIPVNGQFSAAQKDVYQVVLAAQQAAIAEVKTGNHWDQPHQAAVEIITQGLVSLGILTGNAATLVETHAYKQYYMHRTGHWLGLDVHDVGDYKVDGHWRLLEPGMVLTIEPGLYLSPAITGLNKKWWNIGIRIEDDVLVTKNGPDVLSKDAPKTVSAIESCMAEIAS